MRLRMLMACILIGCSESGEVVGPEDRESEHPDVLRIKESTISYTGAASVYSDFERHRGVVTEVYGKHALGKARGYVLKGHKLAFSEIPAATWARAESSLGGRYFGTTAGRDPKCPVVVVVPGIFTSSDGVAVAREEVQRLIDGGGMKCVPAVFAFYNPSTKTLVGVTESCLARAFQLDLPEDASKCPGALGDLLQARRQMAEILGNAPLGIEAEARQLAELVQKLRGEGRPVILVGHSQGVLMVIQALKTIRPEPCIKSASLGSPVGQSAFTRYGWQSSGFMVEGDILSVLGGNDFEQLSTDISRQAKAEVLKLSQLAGPIFAWKAVGQSINVHSFTSSYMAGQESRNRTLQIIGGHVTDLYERDCIKKADPQIIYASSGNAAFSAGPSSLWRVDPVSQGIDLAVGVMETATGERPVITDIARHPDGSYWAVSYDKLYKLDVATARISEFSVLEGGEVNAATFDNDGYLYTAARNGMLVKRSLSPLQVKWIGFIGEAVSGDMDFSPDGKLYIVLDILFSGPTLATLSLEDARPNLCSQPIGFQNVWGLVWRDGSLLGLTAESGGGNLIRIDPVTCAGSRIRALGFQAFGAARLR